MRLTRRQTLYALSGSVLAPSSTFASSSKPIWNGKDFSGWQHAARGLWTVEDGAIVGRFDRAKPGPGYLLTTSEFQDFRLELEYWVSIRGNSGVYVREPSQKWGHAGDERPAHGNLRGYEIQVDYNDPKNLTGSIYGIQQSTRLVGAEESWNRMAIECQGPRIRVWVNEELVNDYQSATVQKGVVGMQVHGGKPHDHVVKYREIRLAEL